MEAVSVEGKNYYKTAIHTHNDIELYDVLCYDGLILGKCKNDELEKTLPNAQTQKPTTHFVLMRYSADAEPETLWHGEIQNFDPGYNLEIFPHPDTPDDYLVFTHPASNQAGSHCYWLTNQDDAPTGKCIDVAAAQTNLIGLKYIHRFGGKFIGVFYENKLTHLLIGMSHKVIIAEIGLTFRNFQNQLIFNGTHISINVMANPLKIQESIIHRICSYVRDEYMVFSVKHNLKYEYNMMTHRGLITFVPNYNYLMPSGQHLTGWEGNMPIVPEYFIRTYPIPNSLDCIIMEYWHQELIYIYKSSDNLFHPVNAPLTSEVKYNDIKFLNERFLIITKNTPYENIRHYFLAELDTEKLTLSIIGKLPVSEHLQSVHFTSDGAFILNNTVYEPITRKLPTPFASRTIGKVVSALSNITPGMANLVGKWSLAKNMARLGK